MLLRQVIAEARVLLAAAGCDTPALDAELLAAHALGVDRMRVWIDSERALTPRENEQIRLLVARRERREPLPYIIGEWEFFGRSLEVSSAVLIPRPETETLVEACLARLDRSKFSVDSSECLGVDVGTGSGAIAIALAHTRPDLHMFALDSSDTALAIAQRNVVKYHLAQQIDVIQSNLLSAVPRSLAPGPRPLTFIAANLPYIPTAVIATLAPEVRDYEPRSALDGGLDGLNVVRALTEQAPEYLSPGGFIALEISPEQAEETCRILDGNDFGRCEVVNDLAGRARVVVGWE